MPHACNQSISWIDGIAGTRHAFHSSITGYDITNPSTTTIAMTPIIFKIMFMISPVKKYSLPKYRFVVKQILR